MVFEIDCLTKMQSDISAQNLTLDSSNDSNNQTIFRLSSSSSSNNSSTRNDSKHLESCQDVFFDDLIGSKRQSLHENFFPNIQEIQESPPITTTQKASSSLDISVKGILEEMSKSTDEVKVVMRRAATNLDRSSRLQRARSLGSIQTESTIKFNNKDASDEFIEIFDNTLVYIAVHKCSYWDSKNTIRKGKIYITTREVLFKCSGTPFVKMRVELKDIVDVVKIKNYQHKMSNVLSIGTREGKSYVFYKFRLPRNLMRSIILKLVDEAKTRPSTTLSFDESGVEAGDTSSDAEHIIRLKRMSQPFHSFASMIRTSFNANGSSTTGSKSNSSDDEDDDENTLVESSDKNETPTATTGAAATRTLRSIKQSNSSNASMSNNEKKKMSRYQKNFQKNLKLHLRRAFSKDDSVTTEDFDENDSGNDSAEALTQIDLSHSVVDYIENNNQDLEEKEDLNQRVEEIEEINDADMNNPDFMMVMMKSDGQDMTVYASKSSTAAILLIFLSLVIFFALAINNIIRLSSIERQLYNLN